MITAGDHLLSLQRAPESAGDRAGLVCLDRNERVTPYPPAVFKEMLATLRPEMLSHYPDTKPLYERLARSLQLPENCLYLTPGSDAAIRMIFQTYLRPGDAVVMAEPSYAMYSIYTRIFQARPMFIPYSRDLVLNTGQLFDALKARPRILVLANPDQPTGAVLPLNTLREAASRARRAGALFLIDEAYYPFHNETALPLIKEFDNVIVTRTFSKAGGLAGLRLGYFVANPALVEQISRVRGAHEVNAIAVEFGSYVMDHPELRDRFLADIEDGRKVLLESARSLGVGCPPCPTNFQLLRFNGLASTAKLVTALKDQGYLVKGDFASPAIVDCIRVTLAEPAKMQGFAAALKNTLGDFTWTPRR